MREAPLLSNCRRELVQALVGGSLSRAEGCWLIPIFALIGPVPMRRASLSSVNLAYFGRVDPAVYGIKYSPLIENESHGRAVVSASFLMGRPYWVWRRPGQLEWAPHLEYAWLQKYQPVARVGSMFVYDLP